MKLRAPAMLPALVFCLLRCSVPCAAMGRGPDAPSPIATPILPNGDFARTDGANSTLATGWSFFGSGYALDAMVRHGGDRSLRCANGNADHQISGASCTLTLNQTRPEPIVVSGWSRAEGAGGVRNSDYSVYVDAEYTDGSPLYGANAAFAVGTHDWQRETFTIRPAKPLRILTVYVLFRNHTGTVWFADIDARVLNHPFDSQPIAAPVLATGQSAGWFVRDVAADGPIVPLPEATAGEARGDFVLRRERAGDARVERATVENRSDRWRMVTVYRVQRVAAGETGLRWWNDIRSSLPLMATGESANLVAVNNTGVIGEISLYPFGCVTAASGGQAIAVPPDIGPRVQRIGYQAEARLLYAAFDLALPPRSLAPTRPAVRVAAAVYPVNPAWGFRDAAATYYRLFPEAFTRRATKEGIWMPFTDPAKIPNVADFALAYHEGDNSVASDNRLGILSFTYTEPMTYWQALAPSIPRTYDAALAEINRDMAGPDEKRRKWAQAVWLSGSEAADGRFNVEFQNQPWANGAVWVLNPNPRLPHGPDEWTKARLNYPESERARFAPDAKGGTLDGEYLDSLEGWADYLDYRPESLARTMLPLTYSADTLQPALPTWFSVYEYTSFLSRDLHARHKLLFANTALARFPIFAPILDVMGIETVWGTSQDFRPDSDAIFNFRRTLCYHKPYLLLQNNDFDRFGSDAVDKYVQRCLFYGVFPSMFSANAADHTYWDNPAWYERDRPTFKRYLPTLQRLSAAGWEPVTYARSSDPTVYVERFGEHDLTVLNTGAKRVEAEITIENRFAQGEIRVTEAISGTALDARRVRGSALTVKVSLAPGGVSVIHLGNSPRNASPRQTP